MKSSVFLDTNVVLDIVLERPSFLEHAKQILELCDDHKITLFTSALTVVNCAYFSKKFDRNPTMTVDSLLKWFEIIDLKKGHIESSRLSKFKDFEDGLQFFAAKEIRGIDYIVTRDESDFKASSIPVLSPKKFLLTVQK
ncbi:twitching motility protein PilT [Cytophagales bacterium WSM2-2]|nr:twitching motility protein PilT [Cytophagales bacterium WSM2-2]